MKTAPAARDAFVRMIVFSRASAEARQAPTDDLKREHRGDVVVVVDIVIMSLMLMSLVLLLLLVVFDRHLSSSSLWLLSL